MKCKMSADLRSHRHEHRAASHRHRSARARARQAETACPTMQTRCLCGWRSWFRLCSGIYLAGGLAAIRRVAPPRGRSRRGANRRDPARNYAHHRQRRRYHRKREGVARILDEQHAAHPTQRRQRDPASYHHANGHQPHAFAQDRTSGSRPTSRPMPGECRTPACAGAPKRRSRHRCRRSPVTVPVRQTPPAGPPRAAAPKGVARPILARHLQQQVAVQRLQLAPYRDKHHVGVSRGTQ